MTLEQHQQTVTIEPPSSTTDSPTKTLFNTHRHRCCFQFPCFGPGSTPHLTLGGGGPSSSTSSFWDRIRVGESDDKWWAKPIKAFKKVREWSEIVAGPKWKTFIRKFNRNNRHRHGYGHGHGHGQAKFQYDPLSYALNFDDGQGQGQNGHFEEECYVDFSSRYAASARSSMDLGKGAPAS